MSTPKQIYLEPECPKCPERRFTEWDNDSGRQWCEDDVWGGVECYECGKKLQSPTYMLKAQEARDAG